MSSKHTYAIDFGTSNSLVVLASKDSVSEPLKIDNDQSIMKSLFYYVDDTEFYHGSQAIDEYVDQGFHGRFIRSIKKFLPDPKFKGTQIGSRLFIIDTLIGYFLRDLKRRADKLTGLNVESVLLGRPARFSLNEEEDKLAQERMIRAATMAGFKKIDFYAEPLAASYQFPKSKNLKHIFVVDIGAGTSDFSWVELNQQQDSYKVHALHAVSIAGDAYDGDLMENGISKHFGTQVEYRLPMSTNILKMPKHIQHHLRSPAEICFLSKTDAMDFLREVKQATLGEDEANKVHSLEVLLEDNLAYDIYRKIEASKIALSKENSHLFQYEYPEISIFSQLDRESFVQWSNKTTQKISEGILYTLEQSSLDPQEIDMVIVTGGSSQMPILREKIKNIFPTKEIHYSQSFEAVVKGLGVHAQKALV